MYSGCVWKPLSAVPEVHTSKEEKYLVLAEWMRLMSVAPLAQSWTVKTGKAPGAAKICCDTTSQFKQKTFKHRNEGPFLRSIVPNCWGPLG